MHPLGSIFLDFNLPNATTWFYFSLLLAVALFFKFTRVLCVRNWDVVTLFLLVPGLLLLQEARTLSEPAQPNAGPILNAGLGSGPEHAASVTRATLLWFGYLWLLCGSAYFFLRCLMDLVLERRPALGPNLNSGGLAWLGIALFVCLAVVAVRGPAVHTVAGATPVGALGTTVGKQALVVKEMQKGATEVVRQGNPAKQLSDSDSAFLAECATAMTCHLAIVAALMFIGWRHFQDVLSGMAMATFYLLLPYTAYLVDQVHHVLPTALLVWAIACYRLPVVSGLLLGLATGTGYFPALVFPAWLSFYWRRGAGRFATAFVLAFALCLIPLAVITGLGGDLGLRVQETLAQADWQPWKLKVITEGFWTDMHWAWAYRLPVFIAYLAFVAATLIWLKPKNLAHLIAVSAAVVLGIQFWYADQGGVYVLWYLPLLLLLVFRPNLVDREPPEIIPEKDWLAHVRTALARLSAKLLRLPEPTARVH